MFNGQDPEFVQWIKDNNFSEGDLKLIKRTATFRIPLWYLLGPFFWPLAIIAWGQRKIVCKRSFSARPGLLFSLLSVAMYITFLTIVPLIVWVVAKKSGYGSGIKGLIKKGLVGGGEESVMRRTRLKQIKAKPQMIRVCLAVGLALLLFIGLLIPTLCEVIPGNFGAVGMFDSREDFIGLGGMVGVLTIICDCAFALFILAEVIGLIVCKIVTDRRYYAEFPTNDTPAFSTPPTGDCISSPISSGTLYKIGKTIAWCFVGIVVLINVFGFRKIIGSAPIVEPSDLPAEHRESEPADNEQSKPASQAATEKTPQETNAQTKPTPETPAVTKYVKANGGLRIRADANTNGEILTTIPNGEAVSVSKDENGWSYVTYNGVSGWSSSEYLVDTQPEIPAESGNGVVQPPEIFNEGFHCFVNADGGLNLRKGPSEDYESICMVPNGTALVEYGYQENWIYTEYQGEYGWASAALLEFEGGKAKPVIYLYPEKECDVSVSLTLRDGRLSCTYPEYRNGWRVTARPDGTLIDRADGKEYSYLYWESEDHTEYDFSRGFTVKGSDTASFLQKTLSAMGLTPKEYNEFIVYWLPKMQKNPYNLITFQTKAYTDSAELHIFPKPDSMLRVFMAYKPLSAPISLPTPKIVPFRRHGFAVVEWGGTECR